MSEVRIKRGVSFAGEHSLDDFGLVLQPYTIPYPEVKLSYLDNTGGNGSIDLSETFGDVLFYDRVFKLVFQKLDRSRAWEGIIEPFANVVHGKKIEIRFDTDPDFYYMGRCRLLDLTPQRSLGSLAVELRCEPYRYQNVSKTVRLPRQTNAAATVFLPGSRMRVSSVIATPNCNCSVKWDDTADGIQQLHPGMQQMDALAAKLRLDGLEIEITYLEDPETEPQPQTDPEIIFAYVRGCL